jgi:hypothetical protein
VQTFGCKDFSWGLALSLLVFVLISTGCSDTGSKTQEISNKTPDIITNAPQIFNDYKSNEIAADEKYKNKIVAVVGMVDKIGKDILDKPYITLWVDRYSITGVQCFIQQSQMGLASSLNKGDYVALTGHCKGKFINILFEDCVIQKLPPPEKTKKKKK